MCNTIFARSRMKKGNGVPTIPVSTDHQNGDWIDTDIYVGEQYLDKDTGFIYTRTPSNEILSVSRAANQRIFKGVLEYDNGISKVVCIEQENTIGTLTMNQSTPPIGVLELNFDVPFANYKANLNVDIESPSQDPRIYGQGTTGLFYIDNILLGDIANLSVVIEIFENTNTITAT